MVKKIIFFFLILLSIGVSFSAEVRVKDIANIQGVRGNQLFGYGLIVGLDGTGDGTGTVFTAQSVAGMLERLGVTVAPDKIKIKNVAAVMVTANLPAFVKTGSRIDVLVSSLGDAKSLEGGTLLLTPLQGPDRLVYAVAQGPISIGGFNTGGGGGGAGAMSVQKNHPTVGYIPGGALIEREVPTDYIIGGSLAVTLRQPDFTSSARLARAINAKFNNAARAMDAATVKVKIPKEYKNSGRVVQFIAALEKLSIVPDMVARVVVDERTGTIVAGEQVRISTVAVSHGNLSITIKTKPEISQPSPFSRGKTTVVGEQNVSVEEQKARFLLINEGVSIGEVARALNALGVTPRDMISIFQAIERAGALHAELVVM